MAAPNPPPPFSASTVEMVCRALGEAVRGHQIANLIAALKIREDLTPPSIKLEPATVSGSATARRRRTRGARVSPRLAAQ